MLAREYVEVREFERKKETEIAGGGIINEAENCKAGSIECEDHKCSVFLSFASLFPFTGRVEIQEWRCQARVNGRLC